MWICSTKEGHTLKADDVEALLVEYAMMPPGGSFLEALLASEMVSFTHWEIVEGETLTPFLLGLLETNRFSTCWKCDQGKN